MQHASERIAKRYARALFELKSPADFDATSSALHVIADAYEQQHELQVVLQDPSIPSHMRGQVVHDVVAKIAPQDTQLQSFFAVLFENDRIGVVRTIADQFKKFVDEFRRSLAFEVVTPNALSTHEQQTILSDLQKKLGREVTVQWQVNPSLIGGMQLRMGDKLLDGSVEGQLRKLYAAMVADHVA